MPYAKLFDAETGAMKSLDELREGVHRRRRRSDEADRHELRLRRVGAVLTLALYRLGVRGTALYDGSWSEWGQEDGPPVATGPA